MEPSKSVQNVEEWIVPKKTYKSRGELFRKDSNQVDKKTAAAVIQNLRFLYALTLQEKEALEEKCAKITQSKTHETDLEIDRLSKMIEEKVKEIFFLETKTVTLELQNKYLKQQSEFQQFKIEENEAQNRQLAESSEELQMQISSLSREIRLVNEGMSEKRTLLEAIRDKKIEEMKKVQKPNRVELGVAFKKINKAILKLDADKLDLTGSKDKFVAELKDLMEAKSGVNELQIHLAAADVKYQQVIENFVKFRNEQVVPLNEIIKEASKFEIPAHFPQAISARFDISLDKIIEDNKLFDEALKNCIDSFKLLTEKLEEIKVIIDLFKKDLNNLDEVIVALENPISLFNPIGWNPRGIYQGKIHRFSPTDVDFKDVAAVSQ